MGVWSKRGSSLAEWGTGLNWVAVGKLQLPNSLSKPDVNHAFELFLQAPNMGSTEAMCIRGVALGDHRSGVI